MRIILNLVSYALYNDKQHLVRPLLEIMEGKNAELNQANYKLIRLAINLLSILIYKLGKPILTLIFTLTILTFMIYAYFNFDVTYNPVIHSLWAIYYCFVVHQMISTLILSYSLIGGLAMYIRFRFKQVNQQLQSKKVRKIRKGMVQHERLCRYIYELNDLISKPLTVFYIVLTISCDIAFYLTLYGHNPVLRFIGAFASVWLLFGQFFTFCSSALFISEAHKSYKFMNSLMVKKMKHFKFSTKWKVIC